MEMWCSDPREFDNLITLLSRELGDGDNGRYGGYGFKIETQKIDIDKIRKALGFKKSEVTS